MARKCLTCTHPHKEQIDTWIKEGVSFRTILHRMIEQNWEPVPADHTSLLRHASEHLQFDLKAIIAEQRIKRAVDVHEEFRKLLDFVAEMKDAASEWLRVDGKIDLRTRSGEVTVIYRDHNDCDKNGDPKQKAAKLEQLLERFSENGIYAVSWEVKHADIRKLALDTVARAESVIDRFANLAGLYKEPQRNDVRERARNTIQQVMQLENLDKSGAIAWIRENQKERGVELVDPTILTELAGEAQQLGGIG